jgi:hypothetical protein
MMGKWVSPWVWRWRSQWCFLRLVNERAGGWCFGQILVWVPCVEVGMKMDEGERDRVVVATGLLG